MTDASNIQGRNDGNVLVLSGPSGKEVALDFAIEVVSEGDGDRPRITAEWVREVEVDGERRKKQLVYAYSHDSYDGEHRDVIEEGWICRPLVTALFAELGVTGELTALATRLAALHPDAAPALEALVAYDDAIVDQQYGPMLM